MEHTKPTHRFPDVQAFEHYLHSLPSAGRIIPDYVAVDNVAYTMDHYDGAGRVMSYYNKGTGLGFDVITSSRYGSAGLKDAEVTLPYAVQWCRDNIIYAD